jgi:CBS domain-containing protein
VFGGVSHLEDEPPSPRAEFLIAVVGPLTSFGVAAALWGLQQAGIAATGSAGAIAGYLILVNTIVGIFNLIPGFPLDGGRILRAALWRWKGSLARATYLASRAGAAFAILLMAWGVVQMFAGAFVGGIWMVLIGLFLQNAANASYAQIALRQALERLPVRAIMAREVVSVPPDMTVAGLVEQFWAHHFTSFPVVEGTTPIGIASIAQLQQVARDQWPLLRVRDLMRPLDDSLVVRMDTSVFQALEKASANNVGRLAVVDAGRLAGYLSLKDITHVLALRGLGQDAATGSALGAAAARRRELRRAA